VAERGSDDVTLRTLHDDLADGFADMRSGLADMRSGLGDLKVTLVAGFRGLPTRESSEEMVRLLREGNRLNEERFPQLDLRVREQHLEIQQVLRAVVDGQRLLIDGQRSLSADLKALIARLDALIRGRDNGEPTR
jgi:hypothetical protein